MEVVEPEERTSVRSRNREMAVALCPDGSVTCWRIDPLVRAELGVGVDDREEKLSGAPPIVLEPELRTADEPVDGVYPKDRGELTVREGDATLDLDPPLDLDPKDGVATERADGAADRCETEDRLEEARDVLELRTAGAALRVRLAAIESCDAPNSTSADKTRQLIFDSQEPHIGSLLTAGRPETGARKRGNHIKC